MCEYTFFTSSAIAQLNATAVAEARPTPVLFIHVPPCDEPYTVKELTLALQVLVWEIVNGGGVRDLGTVAGGGQAIEQDSRG